jgi:hypothetical protein
VEVAVKRWLPFVPLCTGAFGSVSDGEERLFHAWSCAARHLMPRDLLDRERLQRSIERRLASAA